MSALVRGSWHLAIKAAEEILKVLGGVCSTPYTHGPCLLGQCGAILGYWVFVFLRSGKRSRLV